MLPSNRESKDGVANARRLSRCQPKETQTSDECVLFFLTNHHCASSRAVTARRLARSHRPRGRPPEHGLHGLVLLEGDHAEVGGVLQHHLGHQVPSDGPRLELPRLLPDVAPQLAVVVLRPAVPRQPRLRQLDRAPGDPEPPGLDARRREQPQQHCSN